MSVCTCGHRPFCQCSDYDPETYAAADRFLGDAGMVELVSLCGYYTLISFLLNAFAVPLPPDASPMWEGSCRCPPKPPAPRPGRLRLLSPASDDQARTVAGLAAHWGPGHASRASQATQQPVVWSKCPASGPFLPC